MKFPLNLSTIISKIQTIPMVSINQNRILGILNNRNSLVSDVYLAINIDFILLAKIFKKINSEYSIRKKISTITEAVLLVGFNTLRHIALEVYKSPYLSKEAFKVGFFDFEKYWLHNIAVALFSKKIAQIFHKEQKIIEEYFIAGLFHDIGKIVVYHILDQKYSHILDESEKDLCLLNNIESQYLGFSHSDLGSILANEWNLSDIISEVSLYHHHPENSSEKYKHIVYSVAVSNLFVNYLQIGFSGNFFKQDVMVEWLNFLNLKDTHLITWKDEIIKEIQFFISFLNYSS